MTFINLFCRDDWCIRDEGEMYPGKTLSSTTAERSPFFYIHFNQRASDLGYGTRLCWNSFRSTFRAPSNLREAVTDDIIFWEAVNWGLPFSTPVQWCDWGSCTLAGPLEGSSCRSRRWPGLKTVETESAGYSMKPDCRRGNRRQRTRGWCGSTRWRCTVPQ